MIEKTIGDVIGKLECLHPDNDEVQKEINVSLFHLNRARVAAQHSVQSDASTTETLIEEICDEVLSLMRVRDDDLSDFRRFLRERLRR